MFSPETPSPPHPHPLPRRGEGIVEIATGCALATTSSDCFAPLAMTIIAVFLRAVPAQTLESLPAAGKEQRVSPSTFPLLHPSWQSYYGGQAPGERRGTLQKLGSGLFS